MESVDDADEERLNDNESVVGVSLPSIRKRSYELPTEQPASIGAVVLGVDTLLAEEEDDGDKQLLFYGTQLVEEDDLMAT